MNGCPPEKAQECYWTLVNAHPHDTYPLHISVNVCRSTQSTSLCSRQMICMKHRFLPPTFALQKASQVHTFYWYVLLPGVKWLVILGVISGQHLLLWILMQETEEQMDMAWSLLAFSRRSSLTFEYVSGESDRVDIPCHDVSTPPKSQPAEQWWDHLSFIFQSPGWLFFWIHRDSTWCCFVVLLWEHVGHESMEMQSTFMISWGTWKAFFSVINPFPLSHSSLIAGDHIMFKHCCAGSKWEV